MPAKEFCHELTRQRAEFSRGGRSMDVENRDGRWATTTRGMTREQGSEQAHSAGSSHHCSLLGEIRTVEFGGSFGDREQAPPAHGSGRSDEPRGSALGSALLRPDSSKARLKRDAETLGFCTQGWLQPACACAGQRTFTAVSTSHAATEEPNKRQRKTRAIAMGHPYDR
jgi:hypothetical protein